MNVETGCSPRTTEALTVFKSPPPPLPGDPGSQGLVLSKLCQPRSGLQQRTVSLLIRRPSLRPPPLCLSIFPPHHLPDPPRLHLSCPPPSGPPQSVHRFGSCSLSRQPVRPACVFSTGDSLSGASRHLSPRTD